MLSFKPIELSDRPILEPILYAQPYRMCDHDFACLYIWGGTYFPRFCIEDGVLYIEQTISGGRAIYHLPYCADSRLAGAVETLSVHCREKGIPLLLTTLNTRRKEALEQAMPGKFDYIEEPDFADYIYNAQDLITLHGKKFHAKRNFINRFIAENEGNYSFEPVCAENAQEILDFNARWDAENEAEGIDDEAAAIRRAVTELDEIGMFGVALRLDGKIAAYALGSRMCTDTVLEQIEKAADIPGAYQMINNAFASRFASDCLYINREEDLGIEGLRKAKLSYNPAYLNTRYHAVPKA